MPKLTQKYTGGSVGTSLAELVKIKSGVIVDQEDLDTWGTYSAYIDDQGRVRIGLGSRELGEKFLHKLIYPDWNHIDHIDGNPANNSRSNLRKCTLSQNQGNRRIGVNNTSGYKGVAWHKTARKWRARVSTKAGEVYLGLFSTPELAAKAYNEAATKYFGEFAQLNTVP